MAKRVIVVPYNEQWKTDFETIKQYVLPAINDVVIGIEHIGSTSVEGLSAKPIIDIDIVIKDYSVFDTVLEKLASLGYIHEGNLGIKDREAFDYKGNVALPKHHLYVCPEFSAELHRHITFRDYLRNNPDAVLKYSKMKEEGAKLFPDSIDEYIAYKSTFIEEIYKKCGLSTFVKQKEDNQEKKHFSLEEYQIINGTYDQQMAAIQTVITICTTISSAILVVVCSNNIWSDNKFDVVGNGFCPMLILLFTTIIMNLCCFISIISQMCACKNLRDTLYEIEQELNLYEMHKTNKFKISFILTIIGSATTLITFVVLLILFILL